MPCQEQSFSAGETQSLGAAGDPRAAEQGSDCIAHTINQRVSCPGRFHTPAWDRLEVPDPLGTAGELRNEKGEKQTTHNAFFRNNNARICIEQLSPGGTDRTSGRIKGVINFHRGELRSLTR